MKKQLTKGVAMAALCAMTATGIGTVNVQAEEVVMTDEMRAAKMEEMKQWMEEAAERNAWKDEYTAYELTGICADEWVASGKLDAVLEYDDVRMTVKDGRLLECVPKDKNRTELVVPEEITSISSAAFGNMKNLKKLYISSNVTKIDESSLEMHLELEEIIVDEENPNYCSVDGVLFTKDMSTILMYPSGKKDVTYEMPEEVEELGQLAFSYVKNLVKVQLSDRITKFAGREISEFENGIQSFIGCDSLEVYVPNNAELADSFNLIEEGQNIIQGKISEVIAAVEDLIGDLNGDGKVTLKDAQIALKAALNIEKLPSTGMKVAAASEETAITLKDAQAILRMALGIK